MADADYEQWRCGQFAAEGAAIEVANRMADQMSALVAERDRARDLAAHLEADCSLRGERDGGVIQAFMVQIAEIAALVQRIEHDHLRWEDPIPLPMSIIRPLREALIGDEWQPFGDGCDQCQGAADRWRRNHRTEPPWLS